MSPAKQYREYLKWFNQLAKTTEGLQELRAKRAGFNWQPDSTEFMEPYTYGFWCMCTANVEDLKEAVAKKIEYNHAVIADACQYVGGNPANGEKLNPEYVARAEWTKRLRKQYAVYSGSSEVAEDVVFGMKQEHGDLLSTRKVTLEDQKSTQKYSQPIPNVFKRIWKWLFRSSKSTPNRNSYVELQEKLGRYEE